MIFLNDDGDCILYFNSKLNSNEKCKIDITGKISFKNIVFFIFIENLNVLMGINFSFIVK